MEVSELYKCDTIIVGRSNRSSLDRLFLGSVSNYVVKNSDLTVIVVSGERSEE